MGLLDKGDVPASIFMRGEDFARILRQPTLLAAGRGFGEDRVHPGTLGYGNALGRIIGFGDDRVQPGALGRGNALARTTCLSASS